MVFFGPLLLNDDRLVIESIPDALWTKIMRSGPDKYTDCIFTTSIYAPKYEARGPSRKNKVQ